MRFSKKTMCFYPVNETYATIPDDLITVPHSDYDLAMSRNPGDTLDVINGRVVVVPKPEKTLYQAKIEKQSEMKVAAGNAIVAGITFDGVIPLNHYQYPTTLMDQQNINGLVTESLLPGSSDEYKFWCADTVGVWARRTHTKLQIQALGMAIANHVKAQQTIYEQKLLAIATAPTQSAVDSIIWS